MIDRPRKIKPFPTSVRARLRAEQEDEAIAREMNELDRWLGDRDPAVADDRMDEAIARFQRAWKRKFWQ